MSAASGERHVVFYDGVCALCDRAVRFLLDIDRRGVLSFAQLQGETAARLALDDPRFGTARSVLFVEGFGTDRQRLFERSTAALRILARVGGVWRLVSWLRIVPAPLRDGVYRLIASRRYGWFGRFESCRLPGPELAGRFLD